MREGLKLFLSRYMFSFLSSFSVIRDEFLYFVVPLRSFNQFKLQINLMRCLL